MRMDKLMRTTWQIHEDERTRYFDQACCCS